MPFDQPLFPVVQAHCPFLLSTQAANLALLIGARLRSRRGRPPGGAAPTHRCAPTSPVPTSATDCSKQRPLSVDPTQPLRRFLHAPARPKVCRVLAHLVLCSRVQNKELVSDLGIM